MVFLDFHAYGKLGHVLARLESNGVLLLRFFETHNINFVFGLIQKISVGTMVIRLNLASFVFTCYFVLDTLIFHGVLVVYG